MGHAFFSPSGSAKWMRCPGSLNAERGLPNTTSEAAEEGTAAHYMAELCLCNDTHAEVYVGDTAENGVGMSSDMAMYVQQYVDYVRGLPGNLYVEERVDITRWADGAFGTSDAVVLDSENRRCHVADLKFGKGLQVYAESNSQLMMYALGVYEDFGFIHEIDEFVLHVCQPRLDHFDEWTVTTAELLAFGERVRDAAKAALKSDAPRVAGETQCRWCKANKSCRTRAEWVLDAVADYSDDFSLFELKDPELSLEEISRLIPRLDGIIRWAKDLKSHATLKAVQGSKVPNYKIVRGRSKRAWSDEAAAGEAFRKVRKLKVSDFTTTKLVTPAQAEKLLGSDHKIMQEHVIKPDGKPTLVLESDPRPELLSHDNDLALLDE